MNCVVIDKWHARTAFSCYVKTSTTDEEMLDLAALFGLAMAGEIYYMERVRALKSIEPIGQFNGTYAHVYNLAQFRLVIDDGEGNALRETILYPSPLDDTVDGSKDIILSDTRIVNLVAGMIEHCCDEEGRVLLSVATAQELDMPTGVSRLAAVLPMVQRAGMDCDFYQDQGVDIMTGE